MEEKKDINERIEKYWTKRAHDFGVVRHNEFHDEISKRWLAKLNEYLPEGPLEILDAGTGTGYFAVLLAKEGHKVLGIDLTQSMLDEAKAFATSHKAEVAFSRADVQNTGLPSCSFDAVVTRNLTWTLPDPAKAYKEWCRLLKPGGILLNFDANYADNVRNHNQKVSYVKPDGVYGHIGITLELEKENEYLTLAAPAAEHRRPSWDAELAEAAGFSQWGADEKAGSEILREKDYEDAPMFLFWAKK